MKELIELFWLFAQIGVCTFGGGYAMLPLLQRELVEKRGWVEEEELMDYYAIGQCTPGIIAINTATFIGYKRKRLIGGIVATLGFVFPSLIIITLIAAFMRNFASLEIVSRAFSGIRICVCALITDAVLKLYKKAVIDKLSVGIFLVVLFHVVQRIDDGRGERCLVGDLNCVLVRAVSSIVWKPVFQHGEQKVAEDAL